MSYKIAFEPIYVTPAGKWATYAPLSNVDWDTVHDVATCGEAYMTVNNANPGAQVCIVDTSSYYIKRAGIPFDTSTLSGRTIVSGRMLYYFDSTVRFKEEDPGYAALHIVEGAFSDPPDPTDYGALLASIVSGGALPYSASLTVGLSSPNIVSLNATGLGWVDVTGTTKLGFRVAGDINDTPPTGDNWILPRIAQANTPVTNDATRVSRTRATLNGTYRGVGYPALDIEYTGEVITYPYVCFVWGKGSSYDQLTPAQNDVGVMEAYSANISGLKHGTTYRYRARYYRIHPTTGLVVYYQGSAKSFTTLPLQGNINIDQLIYQHAERMGKFR